MINATYHVLVQVSQLVGTDREATELLDLGADIFALILFGLSLYAWSRRKQPALLVVSLAFFLFFVRHAIEFVGEIFESSASTQLIQVLLEFIILALFFIAIVVKPRRKRVAAAGRQMSSEMTGQGHVREGEITE